MDSIILGARKFWQAVVGEAKCLTQGEKTVQMDITDVRIRKVNREGKMKAIVSVTFDNEFVVHDIKVIEGDKGLFIAMPSRKTLDGEFRDIAHPINSLVRQRIQDAVLEKYELALLSDEAAIAEVTTTLWN